MEKQASKGVLRDGRVRAPAVNVVNNAICQSADELQFAFSELNIMHVVNVA